MDNPNLYHYFIYIEAIPRFELGIKDLQSSALPLGHIAFYLLKINNIIILIIVNIIIKLNFFLIKSLFFLLKKYILNFIKNIFNLII